MEMHELNDSVFTIQALVGRSDLISEAVLHTRSMDDFRRMAVFATVVEQRSMSGAARLLAMSTSAVSQQVRQLERDHGVTLLHRSTRKLSLTVAGAPLYVGCAGLVAAARRAQQQLVH